MDAIVHGEILIISSSKYVIEQKKRLITLSIILLVGFHSPSYAHYAQKEQVSSVFQALEETAPVNPPTGKKSILPVLPRVEIGPCAFMQKFDKYHADCGTLFVKEDPTESHTSKNHARVVSIPIMIFQPAGEVTGDPVVITGGGGPGSSIYIMDEFDDDPSLYYSGIELSTLQDGRPLILMEMRGSGLSMANLDCPAITQLEIELLTTYPYKFDNKQFAETSVRCANRKRALGVDANFYNTDYAINDIDALRQLLGFQKWHLLGISHGTRISLRYAQQYPQHTASLILDSIYPFEVDSYADMPKHNARIFTQPFDLCDADPRCRLENGQPSVTLFASFMSEIKLNPPTLNVEYDDENWTIGQKTLKVSPELVAYALFNNSYDGDAILAFSQVVKDALNKDYAKLSRMISEVIDLQNYTWFSEGAYSSYACYEEIPFSNIELAIENAKKYKSPYWDDLPAINLDLQLCKIWDIKPAINNIKNVDHNQLTLPVLILAGDLDPFTPTIWAVDFHAKLPMKNKTQHLRVWPLKAHNIVYDDKCFEAVITSFLNDPEQTIDNDCALQNVSEIKTDGS
jgi:pimeloyl-ACP methyl ester carboxylesterase